MGLTVGAPSILSGNVTTLIWIGPRDRDDIERNLGYGPGRLDDGYWVCLLKDRLGPQDFEFFGTTLRSGGKLSLPGTSDAADNLRVRVHDEILSSRGAAGYTELQQHALAQVPDKGPDRIAKVIPARGHDASLTPDRQYPMGGGGLQWDIRKPGKSFLVAMHVASDGTATTPLFTTKLGAGARYDDRAKVMRYLESA